MKVSFGNIVRGGALTLDLARDDIHFVLLIGEKGAGKTFFHRHLYRGLVLEHLPVSLKFLFLDPTGHEAKEWLGSPYLFAPVITDREQALTVLEDIARQSEERALPQAGGSQALIIHIEEDALVRYDQKRLESAFEQILAHRMTNNVYIFFSTETVDRSYLDLWLERFVDVRIVFGLSRKSDAEYLVGEGLHFFEPGEHIVVWKNRATRCSSLNKE